MEGATGGAGADPWGAVCALLEARVKPADFAAWLAPLVLVRSGDDRVVLGVPTSFMKDWVSSYYREMIVQAWEEVTGQQAEVVFEVAPAWQKINMPATAAGSANAAGAAAPAAPAAAKELPAWMTGSSLDPRYTFDQFVTGKSNQFAFAAAQSVAAEPGVSNPFFLYGGVGLGKTHLMQAIGWEIRRQKPEARIQYLSAEQFLYKFIRAMRERHTVGFQEIFRSVDVLMVDDIQFIAGKETTQEEFFHTFNTLVDMGKQVILTADKSPHELANVEDRLRSRLGKGLSVEVHAPDVEMRQAILEQKAEAMGLALPADVSALLATNISSNVRELEGALNRLAAFSRLTGQTLTIAFAKDQLKDLFRVHSRVVSVDDIQKQVAEYFKIRIADMHSPKRERAIARPRQVAMYLCKQLTTCSYPDIGRAFGGRDHTTVMHACQQVQNLTERDAQLAEHVRLLEQMLSAR